MTASLLFAALTVAAPALKDRPVPTPTIEGEWVLESRIVGGKPDAQGQGESPTRFVATRDKWTIPQPMGKSMEWILELDTTVQPPTLTMFTADEKARGQPPGLSGIYKIDRDTLIICYVFQGPRPTDFVSPDGTDVRLMTLRRVKK